VTKLTVYESTFRHLDTQKQTIMMLLCCCLLLQQYANNIGTCRVWSAKLWIMNLVHGTLAGFGTTAMLICH